MQFNDMINQVIEGDCLDVMRDMPDNSVDIILTDPPYGIGENNEKNLSRGGVAAPKDYGYYDWDYSKISKEYFYEITRISKNQIVFGGNYYCGLLGNTNCFLVWDKDNGTTDFADCELAWTSFKTATRKYLWRWNGMLQQNMKDKEVRVHPTQKPMGLIRKILFDYSKETDIILDPFLGSGTTALAAMELGRRWIGIEKESKYVAMARARIARYNAQLKLGI